MLKKFTRQEILTDLQGKIKRKEPIIFGGAGIGLIARMEDLCGIDAIMGYNTGPFRMDGHPSCVGYLAYGDSNQISMDLIAKLAPIVKNTPIIGGIGAGDPYRDMDVLIERMMELGCSGITNVPTAGAYDGFFRHRIDTAGVGYPEEIRLIGNCRQRDIFTAAYVYHEDEVRAMCQAGADCLSAHVGATSGGTVGFKDATSLDKTIETTQKLCEIAKQEKPDIIFLCHGGHLEDPAAVQECFSQTDVHGFVGASSVERIPVEKAIEKAIREYKSLKLR